MYHSIAFGRKNTWVDWHLIPTSRPVINPPDVVTQLVEIPGRNGYLDLSEILTGAPTYRARSGSFSFYVMHDYWPSWITAYETISNYLHGKQMKMILEDDPKYYYSGRFRVDSWSSDEARSTITISYSVQPFKEAITSSADAWIWDDLTDDSSIREYRNLVVNGTRTVTITGSGQPVQPSITSNATMTLKLTYDGTTETFSVKTGTNTIDGLYIRPGTNTLVFTGSGTVTIDYREASL